MNTNPAQLQILLRNEEITLKALFKSKETWLDLNYGIVQPGKVEAVDNLLILFYYHGNEPFFTYEIRKILKRNGIDLRRTSNGRKVARNKSRRLEGALSDLGQMGILSPKVISTKRTEWNFSVNLRKRWTEDLFLLEEKLQKINPERELRRESIDYIFTKEKGEYEW